MMNALNLKCGGSKPPPYKGVWAKPDARVASNAVIQRRNWRDKTEKNMYGMIKVYDHNIIAINQSNSTIIVRDRKDIHIIDLKICADNFKKEYGDSNGKCVGDRNAEGKYFCFHTSGINTIIYFKRNYICNLFGKKVFFGNRLQRFHQLQKNILKLGYTTYDLT